MICTRNWTFNGYLCYVTKRKEGHLHDLATTIVSLLLSSSYLRQIFLFSKNSHPPLSFFQCKLLSIVNTPLVSPWLLFRTPLISFIKIFLPSGRLFFYMQLKLKLFLLTFLERFFLNIGSPATLSPQIFQWHGVHYHQMWALQNLEILQINSLLSLLAPVL